MKTKRLLMRVFFVLNLVGWILLISVLTVQAAPPQQGGTHVVRRGETLAGIAARYGTTVAAIAQANGIRNPNHILVNQRLGIPAGRAAAQATAAKIPASAPSGCTYRIVRGDTLASIAGRFGTSVGWLMQNNGLSSSLIIAGRTLRVCGGGQPAQVQPAAPQVTHSAPRGSYRVRPGDTLSGIALLYRTTVRAIMTANGLGNPNHIYAGQALQIPLR